MGDARKRIRNRNRRRKQTWASRQRNVASSSAQLMVWLWAVLCNSELCEQSQPRSCCSSENDGHILYGCLSPHFQAKPPFKNTSLTVVVYCQAVKGPALFLLIPLLPSCVNVKCVQSMLSALLGPHWSAVFELACTSSSLSINTVLPLSSLCSQAHRNHNFFPPQQKQQELRKWAQKTGGWYRLCQAKLKVCL